VLLGKPPTRLRPVETAGLENGTGRVFGKNVSRKRSRPVSRNQFFLAEELGAKTLYVVEFLVIIVTLTRGRFASGTATMIVWKR
jgi:hypothetical protein